MDYRIEITWEEDPTQPTYDSINLHGYYSTNFQTFVFDEAGHYCFTNTAKPLPSRLMGAFASRVTSVADGPSVMVWLSSHWV